jgi:hypothetical protein
LISFPPQFRGGFFKQEFLMRTETLFSSASTLTTGATSPVMQLTRFPSFSVISVVDNTTPAAFAAISATTAVDPSTDAITIPAHGMAAGLVVRVAADGGGTLPTGLAAATDYFVIVVDATTIKLAASYANAVATVPVPVNITADGSGAFTLTPTAISGSLVLQASNDASNWAAVTDGSLTIDGDEAFFFEKASAQYAHIRAVLTLSAGQATVSCVFNSNL